LQSFGVDVRKVPRPHIRENLNSDLRPQDLARGRTRIDLFASPLRANSIYFGLKLQASLSAIEETKQNIKFLRQLLVIIKLWASVLTGEQHVSGGDAHGASV
jgi:hypothetical protein